MTIVIDTNVLVSGLLGPHGPPARVIDAVVTGRATVLFDSRIIDEYREVLARPRFSFDQQHVAAILDLMTSTGRLVTPPPLRVNLPDPDDAPFLEVAIAGAADFLITGNLRHFPAAARGGIRVVSPRQWLNEMRALGE